MKRLIKKLYKSRASLFSIILGLTLLSGCGSSEVEKEVPIVEVSKSCSTEDEDDGNPDCGVLLLGLTDADGDFLTYQVDVTGITLTRRDGVEISMLASEEKVDFTHYVELSELTAAASVPIGIYTSGTITLNYSDADIQVEKSAEAVSAMMVDEQGDPLTEITLALNFDESNPLVVARARAALLELDFNLAASHDVNLTSDPVSITTEPFIIAEIDPVENKEFRIRGPLIRTNEAESYFRIAVRPFYRQSGRFGGTNLTVDENTNFDINGEVFVGEEGLAEMANLAQGTPTVTLGLFERADGEFGAITVLAGSSVPGNELDAVRGVIVARDGNQMTVKGASLIRTNGEVSFREAVTVTVADTTQVHKSRSIEEDNTIADLSVGQAVTILGVAALTETETLLDATEGAVKMRLTYASGHSISHDDLNLNLALQALQGREPSQYDFAGTGIDADFDADPNDYEVNVSQLNLTAINPMSPIRISGFVAPFATAPADFEAYNLINYANSRSQIIAKWPLAEGTVGFTELTEQSITLNLEQSDEAASYKLVQGGVRTDLTSFESDIVIQPKAERGIYTIRSNDTGVMAYSNFAEFSIALQSKLNEGSQVELMHAIGGFEQSATTLSALKIAIKLQ